MLEIKGKINTALCYAKVIDENAIAQIRRMCDCTLTEGCRIRIMPDVHTGKEDYFIKRNEIIINYKAQGRRSEIQKV